MGPRKHLGHMRFMMNWLVPAAAGVTQHMRGCAMPKALLTQLNERQRLISILQRVTRLHWQLIHVQRTRLHADNPLRTPVLHQACGIRQLRQTLELQHHAAAVR